MDKSIDISIINDKYYSEYKMYNYVINYTCTDAFFKMAFYFHKLGKKLAYHPNLYTYFIDMLIDFFDAECMKGDILFACNGDFFTPNTQRQPIPYNDYEVVVIDNTFHPLEQTPALIEIFASQKLYDKSIHYGLSKFNKTFYNNNFVQWRYKSSFCNTKDIVSKFTIHKPQYTLKDFHYGLIEEKDCEVLERVKTFTWFSLNNQIETNMEFLKDKIYYKYICDYYNKDLSQYVRFCNYIGDKNATK